MTISPQQWLSMGKEGRSELLGQLVKRRSDVDFIGIVGAGDLGVYASLGVHFNYAIFGRDSIQVATDLLGSNQLIVKRIIETLACLQGVKSDAKSEEEPGKIHHEYRSRIFNGDPIPEISLNILRRLQQAWGDESADDMHYYGSYDATPMYIKLVGAYVEKYGQEFLNEIYRGLNGDRRIADSLYAAASWLAGKIEHSPWTLLEYRRTNQETGIQNQVWKDSVTSSLHLNGEIANYDGGIASIELQGFAYDALMTASRLVGSQQERATWWELASQLQQETLKRLWMPETKYFAQGLDRSPEGQTRQIQTLTSNPAVLLGSGLINDLTKEAKDEYVPGIVAMISSREFLTAAGVRSRALKHKQMPGFVDYHGSYTVWPKETYDIARGLRRIGEIKLAMDLEARIIDSIQRAADFYEFFYVNDDGRVWYEHDGGVKYFQKQGLGHDIATPESCQAWTISAVISILNSRQGQR